MILRPRQALFVERSLSALDIHGNTLGVAPTGTGKTIILSAVTGKKLDGGAGKACVLAHRDDASRVGQQAGPNDLFMFFYSGHGQQEELGGDVLVAALERFLLGGLQQLGQPKPHVLVRKEPTLCDAPPS